ncbi:hypothetical protein NBRC10512_003259 [Rhodotorula toruloides]|uniref:RHTO0S24e01816g1_1 n=2 Tax=Rhodotorula toruloides TaxID=5286 RepID=A0A061BGX2_RHOTO|nr:uncharacterized protein RHTO_04492 [Rhodotorula toruloides NP11]EMS19300.1 hypothetical protein RHTO_04492 [Rhodotorula toruloides NP11]KAJ8296764.1 hypothetical protein OF846_000046 [Rhodotorula toruloides]CDR49251.1 RHTO0S24e01816g1_1 [Rhodotorula toruloides]
MPAQPYDPPPSSRPSSRTSRPSSRPTYPPESIFERVEHGLDAVEHYASEAEYIAGQVGKAARVGKNIEREVEEAYGHGARSQGPVNESEDGSEGQQQKTLLSKKTRPSSKAQQEQAPSVVPYQSPTSTTRQRKQTSTADTSAAFLKDLDQIQEAVDDLFDDVELVALQRHRLTGVPYAVSGLFEDRKIERPRSSKQEQKEATKLAAMVTQAGKDLLVQYRAVCGLATRLDSLKTRRVLSPRDLRRAEKYLKTLNSTFASLLDFVEDRAKEEKRAIDDGSAGEALMRRIKDEHPKWKTADVRHALEKAEAEAKSSTLATVDLSSYAGRWLLENPFTELDAVLQTIDLAEHQIKEAKDTRTGSWALGSLLSHAIPQLRHKQARSAKPAPPSSGLYEVGKSSRHSSRSHAYRDLAKNEKGSLSDISTDSDEADDLEKQKSTLLTKKHAKAADGTELSALAAAMAPTSDGFQESQADLIEDAKEQAQTEHIYTPILILYWVCIVLLYIYYFIARGLGFTSPLGNVDLGSVMGNSAWNDTHDGLIKTTAGMSSTPSSSVLSASAISSNLFPLTSSTSPSYTTSTGLNDLDSILHAMQSANIGATMTAVATAAPSQSV